MKIEPNQLQTPPNPTKPHQITPPNPTSKQGVAAVVQAGGPLNDTSTGVTKFPTAHFWYRGKRRRLYKRGQGPGAAWYTEIWHHNKRHQHSLGESAKEAAIETAKIKIAATLDGFKETLRASMHKQAAPLVCTVGEIVNAYERLALDIGEETRHRNLTCLDLVLREALSVQDVAKLSANVLTRDTAERWFDSRLQKSSQAASQERSAQVKRSANSIFNQAKSVFRPKAQAGYRRQGLVLPDLTGFMDAYAQTKFDAKGPDYSPPPEAVIRKTLHEWLKLTDRNVFIAVGLALACGLRKEEIQQTTWGMFTRDRYGALLDGRGWVKNQTGRFEVQPVDPFWRLLNRRVDKEQWRGRPEDRVLSGHETETSDWTFRRLSEWMQALGWDTEKKTHALRAYAGSLVHMKLGALKAQQFLRHANLSVTEKHYLHFVTRRTFRPESIRIAWAR